MNFYPRALISLETWKTVHAAWLVEYFPHRMAAVLDGITHYFKITLSFASWTTSTFSQANEADTSSKLIMTGQLFHWELSKISSHLAWRPLTATIRSRAAFRRSKLSTRLNSRGSGIRLAGLQGVCRELTNEPTAAGPGNTDFLLSCFEMKAYQWRKPCWMQPSERDRDVVEAEEQGRSPPGRCSSAPSQSVQEVRMSVKNQTKTITISARLHHHHWYYLRRRLPQPQLCSPVLIVTSCM